MVASWSSSVLLFVAGGRIHSLRFLSYFDLVEDSTGSGVTLDFGLVGGSENSHVTLEGSAGSIESMLATLSS